MISDYGFMKQRKLRAKTTILLRKRPTIFKSYELVQTDIGKTAFSPGKGSCLPVYSFANSWQSKEFYFDKNKLVKVQKGKKKIVTVWEFSNDSVVMTRNVDNVVAKKFYERIRNFEVS
jgi:hypothetical protein